jgi:2-oxoglutarate ferredoxin oxidoreductase subunit gamma
MATAAHVNQGVMAVSERFEIRLAGEGGQGLILAGLILAEAAAIYDGKHAVQTQSYGPEARGGASKSEVVISNEEVDYPMVTEADVLLAMGQEACDRYFYGLKKNGVLIVDSDKVGRVPTSRAVRVPIARLAVQATGKPITANVVALGLVVGLTGVVSLEAIEKAVLARAPLGTEAINRQALLVGLQEATRLRSETA